MAVRAASLLAYHGVNHMGSEYQCINAGTTTFDGPTDQKAIDTMLSWKITIVRVPLNEDCWLGINGEPANGTSSLQYQQDIVNYVNLLSTNGLKVIVDLHWSAPGSQLANKQLPMPDADHAPSFWQSVASTFKSNAAVLLDLYNEPYTSSWSCWRNGSSAANSSPCNDVGFAVAGMQTLVNTVRATGARNTLMLGGLTYANNLSGWLQYKPNDPLNNLAASFHIYNFNACITMSCLDSQVFPILAHNPVIAGEIGENDCAHSFIDQIMPWFDMHGISYLAWTWNTASCSNTPALLSDYNGTPTNFGLGFKNHLATLAATGTQVSPTPVTSTSSLPYHGVNQMGSEYQCLQTGTTTFGGPTDQKAINTMLTSNITIVRIPLNEDCWLGINGEPANGTSALQYRQDIVNYVNLLSTNGLKVIVDLRWSAPGSQLANEQLPMPDADHSPSFWQSVASTFKSNAAVLLDLYNEPYTSSWSCWRDGSSAANSSPCDDVDFAVAGMQTLLNTVRATGAKNTLMLGGLDYANDLSGWLQYKPNDPINNLAASFHIYSFNTCITMVCLDSQVAPVRAHYPVIASEIYENDCAHSFLDQMISWFAMHKIGYLTLTWNTASCSHSPILLNDDNGTPTNIGLGFKNHLATLAASSGHHKAQT